MRNPSIVLNNLANKAQIEDYRFERLYRNLYNPEFFLQAYRKIYAKEGNMTPGTDGQTIDGMSLERIEKIISLLKDESYCPKPAKRTYIPKKNGGSRPLGIPSLDDKLVQEVTRQILESVYEGTFSKNSHGFRPGRSCHTALVQVKNTFVGTKWFVEGDIKGFFDNIDHHTLINLLRKRVKDEKFINLIWKFLRAGYLENWVFNKTYSGSPQGGIISPLLANIYLNELDTFMEKYKEQFDQGKLKRAHSMWRHYDRKLYDLRKTHKENWHLLNTEEKSEVLRNIKKLEKKRAEYPYADPMDTGYKRVQYVRYADDFLVAVIGGKEDAEKVKKDISIFLNKQLNLELSQEKTLITHNTNNVKFLGYNIAIRKDNTSKKTKSGNRIRVYSQRPELYLSMDVIQMKLLSLRVMEINTKFNKWKSIHRTELIHQDDLEILNHYNAEIRGFYNYYRLATNAYLLQSFKHIMEYSMYKTFANKYRSSVSKIISKFSIEGKFGVRYRTKKGERISYLYNVGFQRDLSLSKDQPNVDVLPNPLLIAGRNSLIERLLSGKCEWCDADNVKLEMHHIRKLKDLKGRRLWEKTMIARRRKTMALCKQCHNDLHLGRLD